MTISPLYNKQQNLYSLKLSDIATRRRLSTPKASPIPKRTPSQKSSKSSSTSLLTETPQKLGWFKSLDRLSRKKSLNTNKVPFYIPFSTH